MRQSVSFVTQSLILLHFGETSQSSLSQIVHIFSPLEVKNAIDIFAIIYV